MMTFKTKWHVRNFTLSSLYWLFSFTAVAILLTQIKLKKFYHFARDIYPNANFKDNKIVWEAYNHYWSEDIWPIIYWIPVLFILDLFLRKFYAKS